MVEWQHQLSGHEFKQTLEDSEGQGILACCSPWDPKELDTTGRLNSDDKINECTQLVCARAEIQSRVKTSLLGNIMVKIWDSFSTLV